MLLKEFPVSKPAKGSRFPVAAGLGIASPKTAVGQKPSFETGVADGRLATISAHPALDPKTRRL